MTLHLMRELESLKQALLGICARVEQQMALAIRALENGDRDMARRVIDGDSEVDAEEVRLEEEALKLLALYQPVAVDLRWIVATIKINSDLERIGDLAVNIAQRVERLPSVVQPRARIDFAAMEEKAMAMLRDSLDALVNLDSRKAAAVCDADDEVDRINRENYDRVRAGLTAHPDEVDYLIQALGVSRNLERVGDHATNIAQDVIYMIDGHIVRHQHAEQPENAGASGEGEVRHGP